MDLWGERAAFLPPRSWEVEVVASLEAEAVPLVEAAAETCQESWHLGLKNPTISFPSPDEMSETYQNQEAQVEGAACRDQFAKAGAALSFAPSGRSLNLGALEAWGVGNQPHWLPWGVVAEHQEVGGVATAAMGEEEFLKGRNSVEALEVAGEEPYLREWVEVAASFR